MKTLSANEQRQVIGGKSATVYSPAYSSGCLKTYKNTSYSFKNGKCTFSYWTGIDYTVKWYSRYYNAALKCYSYDANNI
ncbi:MAG: hypothetical protein NC177_17120 [Ruminococcus flavefaciens]|nr:hypothetical protein [Ruminococcus flavefaciens]